MANSFLNDFIKMRQELRSRGDAPKSVDAKGSMRGLANMPKPSGVTLATIIETKPSRAEVIKFLKTQRDAMIEELEDD